MSHPPFQDHGHSGGLGAGGKGSPGRAQATGPRAAAHHDPLSRVGGPPPPVDRDPLLWPQPHPGPAVPGVPPTGVALCVPGPQGVLRSLHRTGRHLRTGPGERLGRPSGCRRPAGHRRSRLLPPGRPGPPASFPPSCPSPAHGHSPARLLQDAPASVPEVGATCCSHGHFFPSSSGSSVQPSTQGRGQLRTATSPLGVSMLSWGGGGPGGVPGPQGGRPDGQVPAGGSASGPEPPLRGLQPRGAWASGPRPHHPKFRPGRGRRKGADWFGRGGRQPGQAFVRPGSPADLPGLGQPRQPPGPLAFQVAAQAACPVDPHRHPQVISSLGPKALLGLTAGSGAAARERATGCQGDRPRPVG